MSVNTFSVGRKCPIPAYGPAIQITSTGPLLLMPVPRMSRTEAEELQNGQIQFGFKEDGKLLCFGVRSEHLSGAGIVSFDAPLVPLPQDDKGVSYLCTLVGVDAETQRVKALRVFAFSREIGDLLWRMSSAWSAAWFEANYSQIRKNFPTDEELHSPPSVTWTLKRRA